MSFLLMFDFFGISPSFLISSQRSFKSHIGVFLSLISFILILVASFLFGKDFYLKETPRVVSEVVLSDVYSNTTLTNTNFTFAFRLEDDYGKVINTSLLDIQVYYSQYYIANNNIINTNNNYDILRPCSEVYYDLRFKKNPNETECIYFSSPTILGGSWSSDQISYIQINIINNQNIANSTALVHDYLLNNDVYITFYFPQYFTIPSDYNDPLRIRYNNYYYLLSPKTGKLDTFNLRSFFFDADNGWIFKTSNKTEVYGLNNIKSDFYQIDSSLSLIYYYSTTLYYQSDYQLVHRSYMKIQELAAAVGGVIKVILVVFQFFMFFYNSFLMEMSLIKAFFDRDNINDNDFKCELMKMENDFNVIKKSPANQRNSEIIKSFKKVPQTFYTNDHKLQDQINKKPQKEDYVNFLKYIMRGCYSKDLILKKYLIELDNLRNKLDISYYINMTNQFYYIKNLWKIKNLGKEENFNDKASANNSEKKLFNPHKKDRKTLHEQLKKEDKVDVREIELMLNDLIHKNQEGKTKEI